MCLLGYSTGIKAKIIFVELRTDEDREINHHGRPVEVGEEVETRPSSGIKVIWLH